MVFLQTTHRQTRSPVPELAGEFSVSPPLFGKADDVANSKPLEAAAKTEGTGPAGVDEAAGSANGLAALVVGGSGEVEAAGAVAAEGEPVWSSLPAIRNVRTQSQVLHKRRTCGSVEVCSACSSKRKSQIVHCSFEVFAAGAGFGLGAVLVPLKPKLNPTEAPEVAPSGVGIAK